MTKSLERIGKTVELAIEEALAELGVHEDEALIEVLDEGESGGLLGFGRRPARVRVSIETDEEDVPEPLPEDPLSFEDDEDDLVEEERTEERRPKPKSTRKTDRTPLNEEERAAAEDQALDFITGVLKNLGVHGKIASYFDDEGSLRIDVTGKDIGNVIGRRGETLEALQYLASLAINRQSEKYLRLILDIGRYRERRMRSLRQQAQRSASRVMRSGRRYVMEPMNPAERRQIHMALADFEGVQTQSEGEDPSRSVVILPDADA